DLARLGRRRDRPGARLRPRSSGREAGRGRGSDRGFFRPVAFAPPPAGRAENHDSCRASVRRKKVVGASGLKEAGSLMQYDLARITVRPAAAATALPLLGAWLEKTPSKGRLLACWTSEIGALNDILLLRGYDDADTLAAERDAVLRG